jgi:hypothetical protein
MTTGRELALIEKVGLVLDAKGREVYTISPEVTVAEAVVEIRIKDLTGTITGAYPV